MGDNDGKERKFLRRIDDRHNYSTIEHSLDAIIGIDLNGIIKTWNRRAEEIFGYSKDEMISTSVYKLFSNLKDEHSQLEKEMKEKNVIHKHIDTIGLSKNGEKIPVIMRMIAINGEGKVLRFSLVIRNQTEKIRIEEDLKRAHSELVQTEKLSAVGQLAAGMAHELRNPLSIIRSAAQFCLSKFPLQKEVKESFEVIYRNTEDAFRVISDLLEFAKPSEFRFREESISSVLDEAISLSKNKCASQKIEVVRKYIPSLEPLIVIDKRRMQSVFINLILNAVNAMTKGGTITINAFFDENKENLIITFSDTGCGISKENLGKLFEPFFSTTKGGTGLGLAIVQRVITEHRGSINAESEPGRGTTITVKLPAARK